MTKETKTTAIAAGLIGAISVVFLVFVNGSLNERTAKKAEQDKLNSEIDVLQKKVDTHDTLAAELENLKVNFAQYIKILPSPEIATHENLMSLIQEKAERSEFKVTNFILKPKKGPAAAGRGAAAPKAAFEEIEITMNGEGTFEQLLRFLNSLERHESFIRVNSFNTAPASTTEPEVNEEGEEIWPLRIALNISTFRFTGGGK